MIYDSEKTENGVECFCEDSAAAQNRYIENGYTLMEHLIRS
jgi:hypothetical protein